MINILLRIAVLIIGYFFGIFQTGYLYGKTQGIDIREHGSGNSGTTNTLRTLGFKAGLITFLGDFLKAVLAVALVHYAFAGIWEGSIKVLEMYAGFGCVLGHNFPFYLKFKGGKGIACTVGVACAVFPWAVPVCIVSFLIIVGITRYVSLGSIVMVILFLIQVILYNALGWITIEPSWMIVEFDLVAACFTVMAIWKHRSNIVRLAKGTENKLGQKAK